MTDTTHVETIVIGAGQAGLATGYHLARRDQPFLILDAHDRVGDVWRNRFDSLRLYSPAKYDGLPGWGVPAKGWSWPTKDEVADYLGPMQLGSRCRCAPRRPSTRCPATGTASS